MPDAWPDRAHLNKIWGVEADANAVIEWNEAETAEWISDVNPIQLLPGRVIEPAPQPAPNVAPLPDGVEEILEHVAAMAVGYSCDLKWNEENMLRADLMNRPERWQPITVDQVRAKCRALGMRADAIDTITSFLQRVKEGATLQREVLVSNVRVRLRRRGGSPAMPSSIHEIAPGAMVVLKTISADRIHNYDRAGRATWDVTDA